jgi:hypothetical protein
MTRDQALSLRPGARLRLSADAYRHLHQTPHPGTATLLGVGREPWGPCLTLRHDGAVEPDETMWHPDWWELLEQPAPAWQPCGDCVAGREAADPDLVCAGCRGYAGFWARPAGVAV